MEQTGYPCSVIINQSEEIHTSELITPLTTNQNEKVHNLELSTPVTNNHSKEVHNSELKTPVMANQSAEVHISKLSNSVMINHSEEDHTSELNTPVMINHSDQIYTSELNTPVIINHSNQVHISELSTPVIINHSDKARTAELSTPAIINHSDKVHTSELTPVIINHSDHVNTSKLTPVIINQSEQVDTSKLGTSVLTDGSLSYITVASQAEQPQNTVKVNNGNTYSSVPVYEIVGTIMWPPPSATQETLPTKEHLFHDISEKVQETGEHTDSRVPARKRTAKRSYSPEVSLARKSPSKRKKGNVKASKQIDKICADEESCISDLKTSTKPFSCDKCGSSFVVNPIRSFRMKTKKRKYLPHKVVDPETNKVLLVCNACGLSMMRPKKQKPAKPVVENKEQYLKEAAAFALSLATSLNDLDAANLYCPVFKTSSCKCLQKYITANGEHEHGMKGRVTYLLSLMREAKKLKQNGGMHVKESSRSDTQKQTKSKTGFQRRRTKEFEDFVLSNRQHLRESINLCERACQKILLYSNNFLHRKLKTSEGACRVERINGKNVLGLLPPITELAQHHCCSDKCVVLALTHSKLLQSWREKAALSQREARRVLAEMLTPCGGTKANCYKFISMVTGCSFATISLVNEYMRKTQGEREPPEHGLKKWWRDHSKNKDEDNAAARNAPSLPETNELQCMNSEEVCIALENDLPPLQKGNALPQQLEMLTWQQPVGEQPMQKVTVVMANGDIIRRTDNQELLHILELPTTSSTAITNPAENSSCAQPTVSVITSNVELESLTNISLNLAGTNVVFLPESAVDTSVITSNPAAEGTSVISYTSSVEQNSVLPSCDAIDKNTLPTATFQLYSVVDPTTNMLRLNY